MSHIGLFLAEGLEEIEGLTVVDLLRRAGIKVTTIALTGKKQVTGSHNITIIADVIWEEADFSAYEGLVLPGGMPGTRYLSEHEGILKMIEEYHQKEKLVAAICAAPSVLGKAGVLQGKRAVCYPGFENQLEGATVSQEQVVRDGNIITSRSMGTAIPFGLEIISYFLGEKKAKEIAASILVE